jgi:abortive infection bacteriophage resistance protein
MKRIWPVPLRESVWAGLPFLWSVRLPQGIPYSKPYLPIADQVQLLVRRQMTISDLAYASEWLKRVGYYRFSGYSYPFRQTQVQIDPATGRTSVVVLDDFQLGTTFEQVIDLYLFDKRLRALFLDAIELIEVALRVEIALLLGARDQLAHLNPSQFDANFSKLPFPTGSKHATWVRKQAEKFRNSNEEFVKHFRARYAGDLPVWIAVELWDFGMMSVLLEGLASNDKSTISRPFGLVRDNILPSWTRNLNVVRNICAHHGRLWNRSLASVTPVLPRMGESPALDHLVADRQAQTRIYAAAVIIRHLLQTLYPANDWTPRLKTLLSSFPRSGGVNSSQGGFTRNWEHLSIWN